MLTPEDKTLLLAAGCASKDTTRGSGRGASC